ncbi:DUF2442 domain-containing protein [Oceanospirillum sediminis]|uniref:DUF2442 domain-containing protein n=1 Tax=Oceanospirillum sediminis TaxID=2760088 RepID=A0A839IWM8_9GAMM|nr:DUF2442 domain-containing protein [Oceanospirillum sediminis]MBB1488777.1 DUF2442 domain-containing protein [Oceanospirillum sediminis]
MMPAQSQIKAQGIAFTDKELIVESDQSRHSVPLSWIKALEDTPRSQLEDYELQLDGTCVYWPQLELTLSVKGLILGSYIQDGLELLEEMCEPPTTESQT